MDLLETYIGSHELRKVIVKRSFELRIPFTYICKEIGVEYKHFMSSYINSIDSDRVKMDQEQFEKMLEILGIDVRCQFIINKNFDSESMRLYLKAKHDRGHIKKIADEA